MEEQERQIPKPGQFYRHFKNRLYQIIAVAIHSETKEFMVVYQALYGDFSVYVRPLSMFLSEVDRQKYPLEQYPQYTQKYRFEQVILSSTEKTFSTQEALKETLKESFSDVKEDCIQDFSDREEPAGEQLERRAAFADQADSYMMEFLDARTYRERLAILDAMKDCCTERILQNLAMSLDVSLTQGDLDQQFHELRKCIAVRMKYEAGRLRG